MHISGGAVWKCVLDSYTIHVINIHAPFAALVDLLVRKPLARLQILLLERRIQYAQPPYLAGAGRVVALDVRLLFPVGGLEGGCACGLR